MYRNLILKLLSKFEREIKNKLGYSLKMSYICTLQKHKGESSSEGEGNESETRLDFVYPLCSA